MSFSLWCSLQRSPILQQFKIVWRSRCKNGKLCNAKINGQSWYLGPELAVFTLFSNKVTDSEKLDMVIKMKKSDGNWKRSLNSNISEIDRKGITDIVNSRSLFSIHKINLVVCKFMLHNHPAVWRLNSDFRKVNISLMFEKWSNSFMNLTFLLTDGTLYRNIEHRQRCRRTCRC